jgi:hypothetical protein
VLYLDSYDLDGKVSCAPPRLLPCFLKILATDFRSNDETIFCIEALPPPPSNFPKNPSNHVPLSRPPHPTPYPDTCSYHQELPNVGNRLDFPAPGRPSASVTAPFCLPMYVPFEPFTLNRAKPQAWDAENTFPNAPRTMCIPPDKMSPISARPQDCAPPKGNRIHFRLRKGNRIHFTLRSLIEHENP